MKTAWNKTPEGRAYQREYQRATRELRQSLMLCVTCGKRDSNFSVRCDECQEKARQRCRDRYARAKTAGLCGMCRKRRPATGSARCEPCTERLASGGRRAE
jgi:hypothetical protein